MKHSDYYVYEWFNIDTNEIFYVGKGRLYRWIETNPRRRSKEFNEYYKDHRCNSRIIYANLEEQEAYAKEHETIIKYRKLGYPIVNSDDGGKPGGKSVGERNGMYHKTHSPEAIKKIKEANIGHTKDKNNNARKCELLDINYQIIKTFSCTVDLIQYLVETIKPTKTYKTVQTYFYRCLNDPNKILFNQYYIKVYRKNKENKVPSSNQN